MAYKVITFFTDGTDNGYEYNVGDVYPRKGYTPTPERVAELMSTQNKRGVVLIREVQEPKEEIKAEKPEAVKSEEKKKPQKKAKSKK